jgi:hypothetical protein
MRRCEDARRGDGRMGGWGMGDGKMRRTGEGK